MYYEAKANRSLLYESGLSENGKVYMTVNVEELAYQALLRTALDNGREVDDRTGVGCRSLFGSSLRFDLRDGFPLMTTRFISFRIAFEEMMFFLRGESNTKKLEDKDINIWKGNTSREFLDSRGLEYLEEGDIGKGYGWQIRNFGGTWSREGFDQLAYLVENIKSNPADRRHYMNYWHPEQVLEEAAIPPCHLSYNCQVAGHRLNACFYMRSCDLYHGAPYNIAGYAFLTHLIARLTGYEPGELVMFVADAHIYNNQLEVIEKQLARVPYEFPEFEFKKDFSSLEEALSLEWKDVAISKYSHCGRLAKVEMAV